MPIDWMQPLQTRHDTPRTATPLPAEPKVTQKRRVAVAGDYGGTRWPTTYLYDENGRCNTSGQDSPFDLVNVADTLAKAA